MTKFDLEKRAEEETTQPIWAGRKEAILAVARDALNAQAEEIADMLYGLAMQCAKESNVTLAFKVSAGVARSFISKPEKPKTPERKRIEKLEEALRDVRYCFNVEERVRIAKEALKEDES